MEALSTAGSTLWHTCAIVSWKRGQVGVGGLHVPAGGCGHCLLLQQLQGVGAVVSNCAHSGMALCCQQAISISKQGNCKQTV
jgi:hypothetical protein